MHSALEKKELDSLLSLLITELSLVVTTVLIVRHSSSVRTVLPMVVVSHSLDSTLTMVIQLSLVDSEVAIHLLALVIVHSSLDIEQVTH